MNKKKLTGKITIVVGGASAIGMGIVRALLLENATVIVPSSNADEICRLKSNAADILTGGLITLPTDMADYSKATDIAGTIQQRFGKIDMVVTALNNGQSCTPLTEMEITDWQKNDGREHLPLFYGRPYILTPDERTGLRSVHQCLRCGPFPSYI